MAKTKKMDNRRSSRKSSQSNKTAGTSRVMDTSITLTHEERNDFLTPFVRPLVETNLRNGGKRLGKGEIEKRPNCFLN